MLPRKKLMCIWYGSPTFTVLSPFTGSMGSPYIDAGLVGGLCGCEWDIVAILTRPVASGFVKTMTGCWPIFPCRVNVVSADNI